MSFKREMSSSQQTFQYNPSQMVSTGQYAIMSQNQFVAFDPRQGQYVNTHVTNQSNDGSLSQHNMQVDLPDGQNNEFSNQRFIPHTFQMVDQINAQTPVASYHTIPSHNPSQQLAFHHHSAQRYMPAGAGSPDNIHYPTSLRFHVSLEAPTAAAQKSEDAPLTYLNKGQFYTINIMDREKLNGTLTTTITLMFYDEAHRRMAGTYWGFWLSQQQSPRSARAIVLDKSSSTGITDIEARHFDRISFNWIGAKGGRIMIKFNCLSTDFSRIKGVKGIPMRIHVTTKIASTSDIIERSFAKIKLFRDKGAERKNKDDQRHLEKIWEKMKGKSLDDNPFVAMYSPVSPITEFRECVYSKEVGDSEKEYIFPPTEEELEAQSRLQVGQMLENGLIKERKFDTLGGAEIPDLVDVNPSYIPHLRKPKPILCLFVKLLNESIYRAIYLEKLTLADLIEKITAKLQLQSNAVTSVIRVTSKGVRVQVDDNTITQMVDELDIVVECSFTQENGVNKVELILNY